METDNTREKAVFDAAMAFDNTAARDDYVLKACGDNQQLLAGVRALLKYHDASSFLEPPGSEDEITLDTRPFPESTGTIIDKYKLLEKIGEGGMAVVYMAEQEQPIRRKVALKIIKLGMDTRQVIARFEAERQALAMMDHPNIAKVLDAGATETGRPYFVMELVTGVSITEYCDKKNLSTKDRLALFIQVCNAVQHAHQKGIIHRDIKPSNVMVTMHDGVPVPKVIDFGIAKATNHRLTEKTLFTRYAHIIGTPAYMSPEQAELSDFGVDTRTDVYSLGVLLYELLTGTTPFSEEELRKAGYVEMQRVIREEEPTKPSTRLSTLGDTLTDVARHRNVSPDVLRKIIRGDLDWIVMKALEKDRARRYDTSSGLAEEIRRHLEHEPVLARGPSTTYQLRKFLRRHCSQVLAAFVMMAIAGAALGILSLWNRDRQQLAEAESSRHRGILSQAREQYARADRQSALETIKSILDSKHVGPEARLLCANILVDDRRSDEAADMLGQLLDERPEVAGAAHALLARILWEDESPEAQKRAEIEEHRRLAETLLAETAEAYFLRAITAATIKEQLAALDRALQLDPTHYESLRLRAFTYYASRKYDKMKDDALVMAVSRSSDSLGYSLRAMALRELGKHQEAIADLDRALALTPREDPQYLDLAAQHCEALLSMGNCERVVPEAQAYMCQIEAQDLSPLQFPMFFALTMLGDYDKATDLFRQMIGRPRAADTEQLFNVKCFKYVSDTLDAGQSWHPPGPAPTGSAFLALVEAEARYQILLAKARRINANGFNAHWSPAGKKLAYSMGIRGSSGVAVYDLATKETELLVVPGRDPKWSPDGKYIAFVRDRQFLRIPELIAAAQENRFQSRTDREVWLIESDGTEPRFLARGNWPCWSLDSTRVYYQGSQEYWSISIEGQYAEPKSITQCSAAFPSVSPDNRCLAYVDSGCLRVKDLASQAQMAEWPLPPFRMWGVSAWSPAGQELCLGNNGVREQGLWICRFGQSEPVKTLDGRITSGAWSADGTKFVFDLGSPVAGIWVADLDPRVPTSEALGPAHTMEEYFRERVAFWTRRIEADPQDATAYFHRARHYHLLHEPVKADADVRRWGFARDTGRSSESQVGMPGSPRPVLQDPWSMLSLFGLWNYERPVPHARLTVRTVAAVGTGCTAASVTADGHMLFADGFPQPFSDGLHWDLYMLTRESTQDPWSPPVKLGPPVNSAYADVDPSISADGLTLLFGSNRPGGYGNHDLWLTTRATREGPWCEPVNLGSPINSPYVDDLPSLSADGLSLFFASDRPSGCGSHDLWVATRKAVGAPWSQPENLGPVVNSSEWDGSPSISADGQALFFASLRPGGGGEQDLWVTRRAATRYGWTEPENLGPMVNTPYFDSMPCISHDGSTLYFLSDGWHGPGSLLWQASVEPVIDFNSDGFVGLVDLAMLIEDWVTHETCCDIGPKPWGDGKVDIEDLKVFMSYWERENLVNSQNVR